MTRFAIKGLLSRKLRTALTAIAIVLGVAMISGTFVLTDSIDQAFGKIFTDIRQGSDAVISGKSAFDTSESDAALTPTFDEALLPKVRQLPEVGQAEGSVSSETTHLIDQDGKVIQFGLGGAPNLGFSIANPQSPFNPLTPRLGALAGTERGRDRQGDGLEEAPRGGSEHRRPGRRGRSRRSASPGSSSSAPASRSAERRSRASSSRPPRSCSASKGSSTRSQSPRSRT